jgi:isopentenyl-diphosphate Delta-isomerase
MSLDQVILVNEADEPIGVMDKIEAHRGEGKLHRAISVFLFNHEGQLLIQQRSQKKIVAAGQWANTCCGNVWPGEEYEECAQRRLQFELGITTAVIMPVYVFRYQVQCNQEFSENEMDHVFMGWYEGAVKPNPDEVSAVKWIPFSDYKKWQENSDVAPWTKMLLEEKKFILQTEHFLKRKL